MLIYNILQKLSKMNNYQPTEVKIIIIVNFKIISLAVKISVTLLRLYIRQIYNLMMTGKMKDVLGDYDFSRSDKFYLLKIPSYNIEEGLVLYEIHLKDLTNCETYVCKYRFKQLKNVHQSLEKIDFELPPFPKTHFWQKTNSNPELIQKRRIGLEAYFSKIVNDPYVRGYPEVKKIIRMCKKGNETKRRMSDLKTQDSTQVPRSHTFDKVSVDFIPKEQWQKLRRKNTMLM